LRHQNPVNTLPLPDRVPHASPISLSIFRPPEYFLVRSANHEDPHYALSCYLFPLRPKYPPQHLKILSLCSCLTVRDQVPHPYKTDKIIMRRFNRPFDRTVFVQCFYFATINYATCFDPMRAIIMLYKQWCYSRYRCCCHLRDRRGLQFIAATPVP